MAVVSMNGAGLRKRPLDIGTTGLGVAAMCVLAFLYVPIVTLIMFSFNSNSITRLPLESFTFDWYIKAFNNPDLMTALWNSLIVGSAAVVICLVIGIPTALALDRYDFPGKTVFRRLVILPITLPGLITGVSMLTFFREVDIQLSMWTVIVGHGTALTAIVVTNVFARLQRFDRRIEEASADLGATPWQTFRFVTLPNIKSAIIGSSLISFTLSFDEIPVTFFLTGRDNTLPMYIWSVIRRGITPEINAIGTVIVVVSIALILISVFMMYDENEKSGPVRK
ncbi:MAG: ABC transporter permease [Alphaproteobacteria bacterium]|jgi:spermidine/putrescine transport system permease protein|nr:ABC transporter permease [Rhodospirillaceae bacterium]MBT6206166.1 ABC transporter permease [Rhodospirillaceae bacterium]MBT6510069.1 ABC transporter permease [Rhodospirillaceae bacterium]MBT7614220.1 ABC transporter permease [Rhodospirillaceae bacterium]MDG2482887.1 ABC transporter permease [Alphaproteobacteria bacterium]